MTVNPRLVLETHGIAPKRSLGQNFLHDPNMLEKIVNSAALQPDEAVLEVGPGTGVLTERLAAVAPELVAVELDDRLQPILDERLSAFPQARVIYQDILSVDVAGLFAGRPYVVVANLPYYITSAILRHLLENAHPPRRLIITVQNEVAERLIAKPDDMSILSVSVQYYGKPQIITRLNPALFWPRPDVESAVVRIDVYPQQPLDVPDDRTFFRVVRAGFSQKRKQLKNALSSGLALNAAAAEAIFADANVDSRRRAETLTLEEWARLTRATAPHLR